MKSSKPKKAKLPAAVAVAAGPQPQRRLWWYAIGVAVAAFVVFEVYWPALHGPFLLDDTHLDYTLPYASTALRPWIWGSRPLLMFSYWLNFLQSGAQNTFGYHVTNVLLHLSNGAFILLAVRKILERAGSDKQLSWTMPAFACGLFLLHPLQTESVSYIASRSETLSVFWVLAAYVVFLYAKGGALSIGRTVAILVLFAAAILTKEHTAVLPALLLLTDYYWNPGFSFSGIRRNWKLYVPIAIGAAVAVRYLVRILRYNDTAGFGMRDLTWYQYFFTECRVLWDYLRLFLVPIGQNLDPDVPISHGVLDHGALIGLLGLLAVTALAWIYRRRFPVASYGWFVFLVLIAPTSSLVPIRDPMAERRLYLPFIGLLLIAVEFLRRWKISRNALIAVLITVLIAESAFTYQRNQLWGSAVDLWKDTVEKSPAKLRPRFQLAYVSYQAGECTAAAEEYQKAAQLKPPTYDLLLDWALADDCAGQPQAAVDKLRRSAALRKSAHVYSQIGMEYGKMGKYPEALDALATAQALDSGFAMTYFYLGNIHTIQGNQAQAVEDYKRVLALDPSNQPAQEALARLGAK